MKAAGDEIFDVPQSEISLFYARFLLFLPVNSLFSSHLLSRQPCALPAHLLPQVHLHYQFILLIIFVYFEIYKYFNNIIIFNVYI